MDAGEIQAVADLCKQVAARRLREHGYRVTAESVTLAASLLLAQQAEIARLKEALKTADFMLGAVATQLRSWNVDPTVNVEFAHNLARSALHERAVG